MNKKNIFIYGAGGFGREVYCWLKDVEKIDHSINFSGFLVDMGDFSKYPIVTNNYVGPVADWEPRQNDYVIIAAGFIDAKLKMIKNLQDKNVNYFNLIHPTAILGLNVEIGQGNIICPNCVLTTDIKIKDFNLFNVGVTVGHDVRIGSYNTFSSHNDITGFVTVGNENYFGSRVSVAPKKSIGERNKISAGSVIFRNIKSDLMVMGNPSKSFK